MKKEILKLTGLTEAEFYRMYPTEEAFTTAYPGYKKKMGGTPEAFPQIATADNFFSYGVPVPPTYYMHGGPTVYPQIQTEEQFFSPVYSNSNNVYDRGGPTKKQKKAEDEAANKVYDKMTRGFNTDTYDEFATAYDKSQDYEKARQMSRYNPNGTVTWTHGNQIYDPGAYANWINEKLGRQAVMPLQKPFAGPYDVVGRTPNWQNLPNQIDISEPYIDSGIDYRTLTPSTPKNYLNNGDSEIMAIGGSYMEAYPQAKVYPQGPVGGSSFYMMQDGGQGMSEPQKDQTFYTQKMNSFFDKLRQAAYKNLQSGIMNSEPDTTSSMPELGMGRYGGMLSYQSDTSTGQTTTPAAAAATNPNYQTVTTADGQTFVVGPNNQLYSPFKGNQTTTSTDQQQQRVNPYPYMNRNGVYVGTGLDNVANWLIPNNPRERYRNIREQQGLGLSDLTPEQLEAIKSGTANVAEISYDTRRALFPRNRVKSVNVKFKTPIPGQQTQTTATTPGTTSTTTASTTNPATNPAAATTTSTAPTATTQTATTSAASPTTSTTAATASSPAAKQDINAVVAQMQADARAKGLSTPAFQNPESDEDLLPADERMRMQNENDAIAAEFKNYDNYKKYREIQQRSGVTPNEYDYNQVYDYTTKSATNPNAPVTQTSQTSNMSSNTDYIKNSKYPGLDDRGTDGLTERERLLQSLNSNDPKQVEYAKYRIGAMDDWDAKQSSRTTKTSQAPSNANSMDAATAQKKASMQNPQVNQAFIDAMKNKTPAPTAAYSWSAEDYMPKRPNYPGVYTTDFRMGGPYVLPMYQGMIGPGQVEESFGPYVGGLGEAPQDPMDPTLSPYGPYADGYKFEPEQDEFEVGFNVGRTKKKGVNPYTPAMIRFAADKINQFRDNAAQDRYMNKMLRAENVFETFDQSRGDYTMNTPAGADFRPDQMVPVGYTGAGYKAQQGGPMMFDVADLFFLTPEMLKKTTSRR